MYVVKSEIKRLAKSKGKRVSPDYLTYISLKLEKMVLNHIHSLGSRGTLRGTEFRAWDNMLK